MEIYTYHSDLLVSLRYFFDKFIFPTGTIKGYQFNIGDRSLQIKNDPKFDLPRIIINYNSNRSIMYRPYTWTRTNLNNSMIPVLYNRTKNLTLEVHEELFEFQVTVIINCESQLSALNIEHVLQNRLILNKYFSLYSYYSFSEIDPQFLTNRMFDVNNDEILNLFIKYNSIRNSTDFCYSVKYSPMIRMDSIDVPIGSTDQRSFSINANLTILNHIPVYQDIPVYERRSTPIKSLSYKNIVIANDQILISLSLLDILNVKTTVATNCIFNEKGDFNSVFSYKDGDYFQSGTVIGNVKSIEYFGIFTTVFDDSPVHTNCILSYDIQTKKYSAKLFTDLLGIIFPVFLDKDEDVSEFNGMFSGVINSKIRKLKLSGTFNVDHKSLVFREDPRITFDNSSIPIFKYEVTPIFFGSLFHNFKDVDPRFISINVEKTVFKKAVFKKNNTIHEYNISEYILDKTGTFLITVKYLDSNNFAFSGTISGKMQVKSLKFHYSTDIKDLELLFLICDFELESNVGHGSLHIERINVNINSDYLYCPLVLDPIYFSFYNSQLSKPDKSKKLYRTIFLSYFDKDVIFEFIDTENVIITVVLDDQFNYDEVITSNEIYWSFHVARDEFQFTTYDSLSSGINILDRTENDKKHIIKFSCLREIYEAFFSFLDIDTPIIFQFFLF